MFCNYSCPVFYVSLLLFMSLLLCISFRFASPSALHPLLLYASLCFASPLTCSYIALSLPSNALILCAYICGLRASQLWACYFTYVKHMNHICGHSKTSLVSGRNMECKQKEHGWLVKEIQAGWRKIMTCTERTKAYIKQKAAYLPYFSS